MQGTTLPSRLWLALYRSLVAVTCSPLGLAAILVGNGIGAVAGLVYWYGGQLRASPWVLWPFIPDSPGSTFWVIPALALVVWRAPGWPLLTAFAAFGVIKYGLWTVVFWALYWAAGGPPHLESLAMTFTHLAMVVEGVVVVGLTRLTLPVALGLGAWFLLNDWMDFGPLQTRPGLPPGVSVEVMAGVAVGLTLLLTLGYGWIARQGGMLPGCKETHLDARMTVSLRSLKQLKTHSRQR